MDIICLVVCCKSHCCIDSMRLLISRFGDGNIIIGNIIIIVTMGMPIIIGVRKEANRFSFIFLFKG